jgi:hypothetical protein
MKRSGKNGFILVEILLATLIIVIAGVAILQTFLLGAHFSLLNKDRTIALTHLGSMMETIISTPFSSIVAKFPDDIVDGAGGNLYANIVGGYRLKNEHFRVTYVDTSSDPLEITVALSWQDTQGLAQVNYLSTKKTK